MKNIILPFLEVKILWKALSGRPYPPEKNSKLQELFPLVKIVKYAELYLITLTGDYYIF